ncbi:Tigger transposable element-derived protein 4, partial [Trichinella papuae]
LFEKADIDEAELQWFQGQSQIRTPISGPISKINAEQFATMLGYTDFTCTTGWVDRFKARHNIFSGRLCGKARSSNTESVDAWLNSVWPALRQQYNDDGIFNRDETGVFYGLGPKQTLKFKGEKCIGGKHSKSRVTVFLCANMTGTDKRKLLVIGNSKKPRCFKSAKQLPVTYAANQKAWMTATIFRAELFQWN